MDRTNFLAPESIDQILCDLHSELERLEQAIRTLDERTRSVLPVVPISHSHWKRHCSVRQSQYRSRYRRTILRTQ
jgi:hypothetical protein